MSKKKTHQRDLFTPTGKAKKSLAPERKVGFTDPKHQKLGHGSVIYHAGKTYEIILVAEIDVQRFPAEWPEAGWYWRHGAIGTVLMSKSMGPYHTAAAAGAAVKAQP